MNKQYKKAIKRVNISDNGQSNYCKNNFESNLDRFLNNNQSIKIIHIIQHSVYDITIIYEELIEIK